MGGGATPFVGICVGEIPGGLLGIAVLVCVGASVKTVGAEGEYVLEGIALPNGLLGATVGG